MAQEADDMQLPRLTIEASPAGIARIRVERKDAEQGFALLRRILPLIPEFDRRCQGNPRPKRNRRKTTCVK